MWAAKPALQHTASPRPHQCWVPMSPRKAVVFSFAYVLSSCTETFVVWVLTSLVHLQGYVHTVGIPFIVLDQFWAQGKQDRMIWHHLRRGFPHFFTDLSGLDQKPSYETI